jgi:hypothetical protein
MILRGLTIQLLLVTRLLSPPPSAEPLPPRVMETLLYLKSVAPVSPEAAAQDRLRRPIDPTVFFVTVHGYSERFQGDREV